MFKKIIDFLTLEEKKNFFFLFFLVFVMAIFDVLGVASIFPFITILLNPDIINTNEFLNFFYNKSILIGVKNKYDFILVVGFVVLALFIFSIILRSLTTIYQMRFNLNKEFSVGVRLMSIYLNQSYSWFLNKNSSSIGKNVLSEVNEIIYQAITPTTNILVYSSLSLSIIFLLLYVDPILALTVGGIFSISYLIVFYIIKKTLSNLGSKRFKANEERFKIVSEAFGAFKDIKIRNLEDYYLERFKNPASLYATSQLAAQLVAVIPRFFLEAISFGGLILITLILIMSGKNISTIIPTISLYAIAGYRLLPAIQTIYISIIQLRVAKIAIDNLHKDLKLLKMKEKEINNIPIILKKNIKLKNINFSYIGSTEKILKDFSIEINAFEKVGIVGTTGCGKTTLIDLILGLLKPDKGKILIDDKVVEETNITSWQKNIGYVPQHIFLSDCSIASNIAFGQEIENIDYKLIENVLKIANLYEFVINLPEKYNTIVGERGIRLSGGERQRIGIARALYQKPKVLIMDEATSALDNYTEKLVMESLKNIDNDITKIIVAHRLSTVKDCDIIFVLDKGNLVAQGKYEDLENINIHFQKIQL
jgi:ABC-type bacteriocin/lantibiotic exporter with double-glycine peptidase domain